MAEGKEIEEFYDNYVANQKKLGISTRHRIIHGALKDLGLKADSRVLEIGCGIGTVSSLIISSIPQGYFLGCDISPESIKVAKQLNPQKNANFMVTDMSDFQSDVSFDFVVFPDVLEHIPVDQHFKLFENISKVCKPSTKVLINIPEPNSLHWARKKTPELLQIIDQSLSMQDLLNNSYPHGFELQSMTPYCIHSNHPNYIRMVLIRDGELTDMRRVGKFSQLIQNLKARFL